MGRLMDIVTPLHKATPRKYIDRMVDEKVHCMQKAKEYGFSDKHLAFLMKIKEQDVLRRRKQLGINAVYKTVDTCGGKLARRNLVVFTIKTASITFRHRKPDAACETHALYAPCFSLLSEHQNLVA